MTYRIQGLDPAPFDDLFASDGAALEHALALRVTAESDTGYPCRVSLTDARRGDEMLLVHHVSNDVALPFRMAHAIYVGQGARHAAPHVDTVPEMIDRRTIGLRAFDARGMMIRALLAAPGEADRQIRALFAAGDVACLHAHNAAYGCFLAAVDRG